ncbi:MAG: glycoside hydrolase family 57 protein [Candidatus Auribacterota bacterium]
MKKLSVAFFWHMHQPFYKDPVANKYMMPWTRLHALKGYYDMLSILEDYPHIKATFNLVPSLVVQLLDYANRRADDIFLQKTLKPASELDLAEKEFLLWNFFMANWETMIRPHKDYWDLLSRRGLTRPSEEEWGSIVNRFSTQDYRDLQVWFNLCWFGYRARQHYPEINALIKKGKGFTEDEKQRVVELQYSVIQSLVPMYKKMAEQGQIELTTSPFYHPILPLVYDTEFARRAMPNAPMPQRFSCPEDARSQIEKSVLFFEDIFGFKPVGMWPSEGSVCPEIIPYFAEMGIKWIATDEEVLLKSIPVSDRTEALFQPYITEHHGHSVYILFRDRGLSDLIGFTYAKNTPEDACQDLCSHLQAILSTSPHQDTMVNIILDGENAWEHFPDGGEKFFRLLYERLSTHPYITTTRVQDYLGEHPPNKTITNLHSGSWINHNYRVWIGGKEENQAWEYLRRTRMFLEHHLKHHSVPFDIAKMVKEEIYIAEGSDWFWWYGDMFSTDNDEEFDRLFRLHLSNIYTLLQVDVPPYLKEPIVMKDTIALAEAPVGFIEPVIDGLNTHFYEWQEAGFYNTDKSGGTMHKASSYISGIFFGFNMDTLYLRLDPFSTGKERAKQCAVTVNIVLQHNDKCFIVEFPFNFEKEFSYTVYDLDELTGEKKSFGTYSTIKSVRIIEIAIPFSVLSMTSDIHVNFHIELKQEQIELERYPKSGYISFEVPGEEFENTMWSV